MNVDEILMLEQVFVDRVIEIILKENKILKKGKEPNYIFWLFYKDFMIDFVDKYHMKKEDYVIKMILKKEPSEEHKTKLKGILKEHEMARFMISKLDDIFGITYGKNETTKKGFEKIVEVYEKGFAEHSEHECDFMYNCINIYFNENDHERFEQAFLEFDKGINIEDVAKKIVDFESFYKKPTFAR